MKLHNLIDAAVEESNLDTDRAVKIAEAGLTAEHQAELARLGLMTAINRSIHQKRHAMHQTALKNRDRAETYELARQKGLEGMRAGMRQIVQDWYSYPLPGGLYLGDANHEALTAAIEMYQAQARYNAARADFLFAIDARLKRNKTVRQSMASEDIEQIAQGAGIERQQGVAA
jgi:hypothetical protein